MADFRKRMDRYRKALEKGRLFGIEARGREILWESDEDQMRHEARQRRQAEQELYLIERQRMMSHITGSANVTVTGTAQVVDLASLPLSGIASASTTSWKAQLPTIQKMNPGWQITLDELDVTGGTAGPDACSTCGTLLWAVTGHSDARADTVEVDGRLFCSNACCEVYEELDPLSDEEYLKRSFGVDELPEAPSSAASRPLRVKRTPGPGSSTAPSS